MLGMDVFNSDAFSARTMTAAVDRVGYVPTFLQTIPGLTVPVPVRSEMVMIEARGFAPALIQTSPRGAPPKQESGDLRDLRPFKTFRLADASRITASELQGIRAFGAEGELKQLAEEIYRRQFKIKANFGLTFENWLLGMVQGKLVDADGTILYDYAVEFSQAIPADVNFVFNPGASDGSIRQKCAQITRSITRALKGLGGTGVSIVALCGDNFFDAFTASLEVRETYKNWEAAAELRQGNAWSAFRFGNILWVNYRGSDGGEVAIPADKAKLFPINAGIFQKVNASAETFEFINTPGQEWYSWIVRDRDRDMWADLEMYSYPLMVCVQPSALQGSASHFLDLSASRSSSGVFHDVENDQMR